MYRGDTCSICNSKEDLIDDGFGGLEHLLILLDGGDLYDAKSWLVQHTYPIKVCKRCVAKVLESESKLRTWLEETKNILREFEKNFNSVLKYYKGMVVGNFHATSEEIIAKVSQSFSGYFKSWQFAFAEKCVDSTYSSCRVTNVSYYGDTTIFIFPVRYNKVVIVKHTKRAEELLERPKVLLQYLVDNNYLVFGTREYIDFYSKRPPLLKCIVERPLNSIGGIELPSMTKLFTLIRLIGDEKKALRSMLKESDTIKKGGER